MSERGRFLFIDGPFRGWHNVERLPFVVFPTWPATDSYIDEDGEERATYGRARYELCRYRRSRGRGVVSCYRFKEAT